MAKKKIDIGTEFIKSIYTNTGFETKDTQPIYILQRDSIRTFLHEKKDILGINSRLIGYFGIEVTLIISLMTAKFEVWLKIPGNIIQGTFIAFTIIIGILLVKGIIAWFYCKKMTTVDALADDLGSRGYCNKTKLTFRN